MGTIFQFPYRTVAEVSIRAIIKNLVTLRSISQREIVPVVKADAYGHGLIQCAKAASEAGADYLGTALLEEAIAIREAGINTPLLAWLNPPRLDYKKAVSLNIEIGVSSLATFGLVISWFWYKAGSRFWELILTAQLNRGGNNVGAFSRIEQIFNFTSFAFLNNKKLQFAVGVALLAILIIPFIKYFRKRDQGILILALFAAQFLVLMQTPVFFNAYPSFVAATFALISGITLGAIHRNILTGAFILALVGVGIYGSLTQAPGRDLPTQVEQLQFKDAKCVTTDSPAVLALTNTLTRDLHNKCNLIFDVSGTIYGINHGLNPNNYTATKRRWHSDEYQAEVGKYLSSGNIVILARRSEDGLRPETIYKLDNRHQVVKSKSFVIIS